jgi:hypothetical protein
MGKRLASIGAAAAIAVGGLAVAAINPLSVAGASSSTTTKTAPPAATAGARAGRAGKGPFAQALKELVANHTITQAQSDKIVAQVKADVKADRSKRQGNRKARRKELVGVVAKALGEQPKDVVAGLKAGHSITAQAQAKGVDPSTVSDAITKAITDRITQAVTAGKLTSQRAARIEQRLPTLVQRIMNADGKQLRAAAGRFGGLGGN